MRVVHYCLIGILAGIFTTFFTTAIQAKESHTLYACTDCGHEEAKAIALEHRPRLNCRTTKGGGGWEEVEETVYCPTERKTIYVGNPVTQTPYKFLVTVKHDDFIGEDVSIKNQPLNALETEVIEKYFELDNEFRMAMEGYTLPAPSQLFAQTSGSAPLNSETDCKKHVSKYFTDKGKRELEDKMTNDITRELNQKGLSWEGFISNSALSGAGLSISKGGFGLNLNFSKHTKKVHVNYANGHNNILNFEAQFEGNYSIAGEKFLRFKYIYDGDASRIDGYTGSYIFPPRSGPTHRFTFNHINRMDLSDCTKDVIKNITSEKAFYKWRPDFSFGNEEHMIERDRESFDLGERCILRRTKHMEYTDVDGVKRLGRLHFFIVDICRHK